jgi:uncharacterized protein
MKDEFDAILLRIHFGEDDKWEGKPLYEAIVSKCAELGIMSAIVYRGIEGFGASTKIHRPSLWSRSKDAPMMVSVIDRREAVEKLVPALDAMVDEGLIAMSPVRVLRYSRTR